MKILKHKLLKFCLVCLLVVSMIPSYTVSAEDTVDTWDGSVDTTWIDNAKGEFHLYTAEQLAGLSYISNLESKSTEYYKKEKLRGATIYFEKDFDLAGKTWRAIYADNGGYTGDIKDAPPSIIDGKGHNIFNLKSGEDPEYGYNSLFLEITEKTTVKNINIIDAEVEVDKDTLNMGVLTGRAIYSATIENCYTSGTLTNKGEYRDVSIGGISGFCADGTKIIGCCSDVRMTNVDATGGIVGQWEDATDESIISDCWFSGSIECKCSESVVGGILGFNYQIEINKPGVNIKNCMIITKNIISNDSPEKVSWIGVFSDVLDVKVENCIWPNESTGGEKYPGVIKIDESKAIIPGLNQDDYGIEVSDFNDEAVLTRLQKNASSGIKWVKGIDHPTFEWNEYNILADYTELDKLLAEVDKLNKNDYVDFSEVESALAAITKDKNKLQQGEVDKMVEDLKAAVDKLEKKPSSGGGSGGGSVITPSEPTKEEIIGKDRYETAALVADKVGSYDTVVLVNADKTMSDGLSASSLSGKYNAPILLVKQNKIPDVSMKRIRKAKKVYIIGGTNAISKEVEKQLSGKNVTRIGGLDRYETSELIAKELVNYSKVFVVNGANGEADAMSASSVAAKYEAPIILTNGKTSDYDKEAGKEYYVIGGKNVVSDSIVEKYSARRIAGEDRYKTNRKVISEFYSGSNKYYVANGNTLVDALTAAILAQEKGVVLVNEKSDNSVLEGKDIVQIGGFDFEI